MAFEDETGQFLLLLAIGTFAMCFVGFFFLRVVPHSTTYFAIPTAEDQRPRESNPLTRSRSGDSKRSIGRSSQEPGTQSVMIRESPSHNDPSKASGDCPEEPEVHTGGADESSSLLSKSSSTPGDLPFRKDDNNEIHHNSHYLDVRGLAMLPTIEFWQLFLLLGVLTGVGLMTIK